MRGRTWSEEDKQEARRLRTEERLSLKDIASKTGISKGTLSSLLADLPLSQQEKTASRLRNTKTRVGLNQESPTPKRPPGNSKATGTLSEIAVAKRLLELGHSVFVELGDNSRYDLIWDREGELLKVQVKTAWYTQGGRSLSFSTSSSQSHRGNGKKNYIGQIDLFAAYSPDRDEVYMVPVDEAGENLCNLRLEVPFMENSRRAQKYLL